MDSKSKNNSALKAVLLELCNSCSSSSSSSSSPSSSSPSSSSSSDEALLFEILQKGGASKVHRVGNFVEDVVRLYTEEEVVCLSHYSICL